MIGRQNRGVRPDIPDDELVALALLGNLYAFDELVKRYRGAVVRVARQSVASQSLAEDVAQDAFLLAFKALPQLQDPAGFAPWLYAITRNRVRRVLGSREGKTESLEHSHMDQLLLTAVSALSINPAEVAMNRCDHARVPVALARLPAPLKIVMELRYYEEWAIGRISEFLSLPATTVKWRLHEGRRTMRRSLAALDELDA